MPGTRFGRPHGRFFSVRAEQRRLDRDLEQFQQVYGTEVDWYFLLAVGQGTVLNDVYDEGDVLGGGKAYDGPRRVPVLSAQTRQGQETSEDQGFYTVDHVTLRLSFEQARRAGLEIDLIANREAHIHDRFVWRRRVFDVMGIQTAGHFDPTNRDVTIVVQGTQLRADELVDSPIFQPYFMQ